MGLLVCRNGCADMHRGGPYWLPPRRAPFGRRAGQPSEGAPTGSAWPRLLAGKAGPHWPLLGEEKNPNPDACDPFHPRGHAATARTAPHSLRHRNPEGPSALLEIGECLVLARTPVGSALPARTRAGNE